MEYIEFFFGNFWHWLGLVVIIALIFCPKVKEAFKNLTGLKEKAE